MTNTDEITDQYPKQAQQLVETALRLFYRKGFHATGIDTILAGAGVSKMTLYKHFGSKDGLILAALRLRSYRWRRWFEGFVEGATEDPQERLLATFDALNQWTNSRDFNGCMFINAAAEFPRRSDPVRTAVNEHRKLVLDYIRSLSDAAGARDSEQLARQIFLLNEAIIVDAQVSNDNAAAEAAKLAARLLLKSQLRKVGSRRIDPASVVYSHERKPS